MKNIRIKPDNWVVGKSMISYELPPAPSHDCETCGKELAQVWVEKPSGWRCMTCEPQRDEEIRYVPRAEHEALKAVLDETRKDLEEALQRLRMFGLGPESKGV